MLTFVKIGNSGKYIFRFNFITNRDTQETCNTEHMLRAGKLETEWMEDGVQKGNFSLYTFINRYSCTT